MSGKKKGKTDAEEGISVVAENRQVRRDFEIIETVEAGIVLLGWEVKSIRAGEVNLRDSYIRPKSGELFLVGCSVKPWKTSRIEESPERRDRKLLLHIKEIEKLEQQTVRKGLTLVAMKLYFKGGKIKLQVGVGRGKKLHDRREDLKKRDADREIARAMRGR